MRVLYFGTYERDYPRNAQVISCLRRAGVEVKERHVAVWEGRSDNWSAGAGAAARLASGRARAAAPSARRLRRGARRLPGTSRPACRQARRTRAAGGLQPARLARRHLRLRPRPLPRRLRRGAGTRCRRSARAARGRSRRRGHTRERRPPGRAGRAPARARRGRVRRGRGAGLRARLVAGRAVHGPVRRQVDPAARRRDRPRRRARGARAARSGSSAAASSSPSCATGPRTSDWVPWVEYERLPDELHRAGCALGIFGTSEKAKRVIPNKAFQALACGTPLVTADTPGCAGAARRRRERAARSARRPVGARGGPAEGRRGPGAGAAARLPAAARPTRPMRAKTCSAAAGASSIEQAVAHG